MPKALSMDLRERAMARLEAGESMVCIALALGVSRSGVSKWAARKKATGSVAPGRMGGTRPGTLVGEPAVWLRERIARADFTWRGLRAELAGRNVHAAYKAVWRFVHAQKLSFKKKKRARRRTGSPGRGTQTRPLASPAGVS